MQARCLTTVDRYTRDLPAAAERLLAKAGGSVAMLAAMVAAARTGAVVIGTVYLVDRV